MIGRAAAANPWIFRQIAEHLAGLPYYRPAQQDRYSIMRTYFTMLVAKGGADLIGKMKQFTTYFSHGIRNGARLRTAIYHEKGAAAILGHLDRFFETELKLEAAGVPADLPAGPPPELMSCEACFPG
jgi:tRNA-dihydrouridine synthase